METSNHFKNGAEQKSQTSTKQNLNKMTKFKKITSLFTLVIIAIVLTTSCGGGKPSEDDYKNFKPSVTQKSLTAKTNEITGELGEYLTINGSSVKVSYLGMEKSWDKNNYKWKWYQSWEVKVKVTRTNKPLQYDLKTIDKFYTRLLLSILDSKGAPISGLDPVSCNGYDLVDQVLSLKEGQDGWVTFKMLEGEINEEDIIANWEQFSISSEIGFVKNSSSSDEDYSSSSSSSSDKDWNAMLDDYEEYVDEYIKFYKKAMKGDVSAVNQYPDLMKKAKALEQSMNEAQNDDELSAAQIQRMLKIQKKMTNAALGN